MEKKEGLLEDPDFNPRNVAKYTLKFVIATKVTDIAKNVVADYTQFEKDNLVVKVSCNVLGWGVSAKLKPLTDKMVDKTADFIVAKREESRKNQKDQTDQKETPEEQ